MSVGFIIGLGLTVYLSMFLLVYFLGCIYYKVNMVRLKSSYIQSDIETTFWMTVIFWPVAVPIWSFCFLIDGFFQSTGGIL